MPEVPSHHARWERCSPITRDEVSVNITPVKTAFPVPASTAPINRRYGQATVVVTSFSYTLNDPA